MNLKKMYSGTTSTITEARMFRRQYQLNDEKFVNIIGRIYTHILALELLSYMNLKAAADYSKNIMKFQDWTNGFRPQASDLYNLLIVILDKDRFKDIISGYKDVSLPEMRIKRFFRSMIAQQPDHNDFQNLNVVLYQRLHISSHPRSSEFIYLRKQVLSWENLDHGDRKRVVQKFEVAMREYGNPGSDLLTVLKGIVASKGTNL